PGLCPGGWQMDLTSDPWTLGAPLLPLLVFVAEGCVVTLGTVRIIFVAKGLKALAPLLGLVEVAIWLFAIGQVMAHLTDPACYLACAAGFGAVNYLGVLVEKRLALARVVVTAVTGADTGGLIHALRLARYESTSVDARGADGPVRVVSVIASRRELDK